VSLLAGKITTPLVKQVEALLNQPEALPWPPAANTTYWFRLPL